MLAVEMLKLQHTKNSLITNFHVSTTYGSVVIKLLYFGPRNANHEIMLGAKILRNSKIHQHQSIDHTIKDQNVKRSCFNPFSFYIY